MKICFKYGESVVCLPAKAVADRLTEATADELRVILAIATDTTGDADRICEFLGMDNEDFMKAVSFWRGSGALSVTLDEGEKLPSNRKKAAPKKSSSASAEDKKAAAEKSPLPLQDGKIPPYTTSQIADILEKDKSVRSYVDNCQQIMGKIFSTGEASTLIGIVEYLGVTTDYVALLCAYAVSHGKKSVRYVEKMAVSLYDEGITGYAELEAHLKRLNKAEEMQPEIRRIFGMGDRALTSKEKRIIESWCEMGLPMELIVKAYEITVTNTGKAAMPYANSILESWNAAGYKTCEDVDAAAADYKRKKEQSAAASGSGSGSGSSSFDVDDFFEAALRRSYKITGGK